MKKYISLLLVMLMSMTIIAGCSSSSESTTSGNEETVAASSGDSTSEPVAELEEATVDVLQFKVEIAEELENAAEMYMDLHPNVTINIETSSSYQADLKAKMAGTDQPEIFCIDGPEHIKNWGDMLEDLSDQPWVSQVNDGLLGAVTSEDGAVYGLPLTIEGYGFIYNKAMFEAVGVDLSTANSLEDFDNAFAILKAAIDDGSLKEQFPLLEAVVEFPAGEKWVGGLHTANLALSYEFNGAMDAFNADGIDFTYSEGFKDLIDLQVKYSPFPDDASKLISVDYGTQVGGGLLIERVAVIQQGNWVSGEVLSMDPSFLDKLDMVAMPITGVETSKLPVGVPTNWAVNSTSTEADKAAAKDFLNWLYTSEAGKDYIVNKFAFIPIMEGYDEYKVTDSLGNAIQRYANEGKTIGWITAAFPSGWSDGVMGSALQEYISGTSEWNTIIEDAVAKWSELKAQ